MLSLIAADSAAEVRLIVRTSGALRGSTETGADPIPERGWRKYLMFSIEKMSPLPRQQECSLTESVVISRSETCLRNSSRSVPCSEVVSELAQTPEPRETEAAHLLFTSDSRRYEQRRYAGLLQPPHLTLNQMKTCRDRLSQQCLPDWRSSVAVSRYGCSSRKLQRQQRLFPR